MFPSTWLGKLWARVAIAGVAFLISFSAVAAPEPIKSGGGKHCLWRVTNAKASFYLLGSIHRLSDSDYPLPSVMQQAISESQQFYFEYDPHRDNDLERKLLAAAKLPRGQEIKDKVHAKTWDYLRTGARGGNFDWVHLKAWAIAMFLLDYPVHERLSAAYGLDNYVEKKARARGRPMRGLESVSDHVAVFGGMNDIESEAYLLQAIVHADQHDSFIQSMVAAWKAGNTDRLASMISPTVREAPGLNPRFLERRNAKWIPVIDSAIK